MKKKHRSRKDLFDSWLQIEHHHFQLELHELYLMDTLNYFSNDMDVNVTSEVKMQCNASCQKLNIRHPNHLFHTHNQIF